MNEKKSWPPKHPSYGSQPLDILKKGLAKFTALIKARKDNLTAKLARSEPDSSSDEHWLDNEVNTIDEQHMSVG